MLFLVADNRITACLWLSVLQSVSKLARQAFIRRNGHSSISSSISMPVSNSPSYPSPSLPIDYRAPRSKEGDGPPSTSGRKPPLNPSIDVLYHDPGRYIVVNKPYDVRMDGDFESTLEKLILKYISTTAFSHTLSLPDFSPRFVQRLDYATSGVTLVALSRVTAGIASTQFEKRTVSKSYLALLHGHIPSDEPLHWTWPIADGEGYRMRAGNNSGDGRCSQTLVYPLAKGMYRDAEVTKVRLEPLSGRRHQLRVHCATAGFPIVGDATYIEDDGLYFRDDFEPPRMMLHAHTLSIALPDRGAKIYGRKSALKSAIPLSFATADPFIAVPTLELKAFEQV